AHLRAALRDDEVRPAFALVRDGGAVRPVKAAAVGALDPAAGVDEEEAVEVLQRVLAVTGQELVQGLTQQGGTVAVGAVVGALLLGLYGSEGLALDAEAAAGQLVVIIVHAAVDPLAGGATVGVRIAAEEGFFPLRGRDFGVVLDVGKLDRDDGEAIEV